MSEQRAGWRSRPSRRLLLGVVGFALALSGAAAALLGQASPGGQNSPARGTVPAATDVGFAQDMTAHHRQAVQMASWERDHTQDPALRQLAFDIETTQTEQLGRMQGWLSLWGAAPASDQHMSWMEMPTDRMPGMADATDLRGLRAATGGDLDVRFLQLMLRHHVGATAMLAEGADRAAVPAVRTLAGQMLSSQAAESDQLRSLLVERGAAPPR